MKENIEILKQEVNQFKVGIQQASSEKRESLSILSTKAEEVTRLEQELEVSISKHTQTKQDYQELQSSHSTLQSSSMTDQFALERQKGETTLAKQQMTWLTQELETSQSEFGRYRIEKTKESNFLSSENSRLTAENSSLEKSTLDLKKLNGEFIVKNSDLESQLIQVRQVSGEEPVCLNSPLLFPSPKEREKSKILGTRSIPCQFNLPRNFLNIDYKL